MRKSLYGLIRSSGFVVTSGAGEVVAVVGRGLEAKRLLGLLSAVVVCVVAMSGALLRFRLQDERRRKNRQLYLGMSCFDCVL